MEKKQQSLTRTGIEKEMGNASGTGLPKLTETNSRQLHTERSIVRSVKDKTILHGDTSTVFYTLGRNLSSHVLRPCTSANY